MTLSICIFETDTSSGHPGEPTLIDGRGGLAGVERTRTMLWGAEATKALGARYLPRLADEDLWISNPELDDFAGECEALLAQVNVLAEATQWGEDYIAFRLRNFIGAVTLAKQVGGGLVVW